MLNAIDHCLVREYDGEILRIEPWGPDAFRVRATKSAAFDDVRYSALLPPSDPAARNAAAAEADGDIGTIVNGNIRARVVRGRVAFSDASGKVLTAERWLNRDLDNDRYSAINSDAREFRPIVGGDYRLAVRFEAWEGERIYGMGQYQDGCLDLKGCSLELAHRNSQASVPFALSSRGYGILWNNPAIGRAVFAKNGTEWISESTTDMDYWIVAGRTPAEIEERYADAVGKVPPMPEFAMGFWQCKLRYKTQEELLSVAREYRKRGLPLSVIVSDFFHWPMQGTWKFDPKCWPDPDAMVAELKDLGVELMVSVWPTVDKRSPNYAEMLEKGFLVRSERGVRTCMEFIGNQGFFDATHPGAREYVWGKCKENYFNKGIRLFWLDEAEPEYSVYDFDNYRYRAGPNLQVGNSYPVLYAKAFHDGLVREEIRDPLSLLRCAWAGSQRYGALVWSGDVEASFRSLRVQLAAGLNMAIAGIPWWTTDIGGFGGGDPDDPAYRECILRWFQFGAFCPVFRLHGFRIDKSPTFKLAHTEGSDSESVFSGGPNEVWSYGEEAYGIFRKYLFLRERMKPYIRRLMAAAHEKGTPVIRPLFYDFPSDPEAWRVEDQFMFGPDVLVAPVLSLGERRRAVYLPSGSDWTDAWTGAAAAGGSRIEADAPLDRIPLFFRDGAALPVREE